MEYYGQMGVIGRICQRRTITIIVIIIIIIGTYPQKNVGGLRSRDEKNPLLNST